MFDFINEKFMTNWAFYGFIFWCMFMLGAVQAGDNSYMDKFDYIDSFSIVVKAFIGLLGGPIVWAGVFVVVVIPFLIDMLSILATWLH